MIITVFILIILTIVVCTWFRNHKKYENLEPPKLDGWLPVIGHAYALLGDTSHLWHYIESNSEKCLKHGAITMNIGSWTVYVVSDIDDSYTVAQNFFAKDKCYAGAKPWLGNGLITADVPIWKKHRKVLMPAFNQKTLDGYNELFNLHGKDLVQLFSAKTGKGEFSPKMDVQRTVLDLVCMTSMGLDRLSEKDLLSAYIHAVEEMLHSLILRITNLWMQSDFLYSLTKHKNMRDQLLKDLHNMSESIISKKRVEIQNKTNNGKPTYNGIRFKSFLEYMLELTDGSVLTNDELREEVDTFIVAGFESTATFLQMVLIMLGSYPDIQERVYRELVEVLGDTNRDVQTEDLPKLVFLEAMLKEVSRLYPVGSIVSRHLDADVKLKKYTLRRGSSCMLLLYAINRDPRTWGPDADQFRPERWLDRVSLPKNPNSYAAFSIGKRNCVGKKFAMNTAKIVTAHVVSKFRIFADYTKLKFRLDITLNPYEGNDIRLENRV